MTERRNTERHTPGQRESLEGAARAYVAACEGRHPDPDTALSDLVAMALKEGKRTGQVEMHLAKYRTDRVAA